MIYCYKKLRVLKLLHIFVLHYLAAAVIGTLMILFLFWLGNGLELYSAVVLCLMYGQPEYLMLRRMEMYKIRAELRDMDCPPCEKAEIALDAWMFKPTIDRYFLVNLFLNLSVTVIFFVANGDILHMKRAGADSPFSVDIFNYCSAAFMTLLALFVAVSLQITLNANKIEELKCYDE